MRRIPAPSLRLLLSLSLAAIVLGTGAWVHASTPAHAGGGKEIPRVTVTLGERAIEAPATVPTGLVAITFRNATQAPFGGLVVRLNEGVTPAMFLAAGEDVAAASRLATAMGGPVIATPGGSQAITYDLRAGTYLIVAFGEEDAPPVTATVRAAPPAVAEEPPTTVAEIQMGDFFFRAPVIPPGSTTFQVRNIGQQLHHMLVFRLAPGVTLQQALMAEEQGTDPVEAGLVALATGLTEVSPGQVVWPTLTFTPGSYAMVCFVEDPATGQEHVELGMLLEFTVR